MLRVQEMLKDSGAQISRQKTEMVEPIVAAVAEILQSRGLLPEFRVDGEEVAIKPTSPLAKAESLDDFQNTQTWLGALAAVMPFEALAGAIKIEELPKKMQEQLDVDPDLVRTKDEREELAEQAKELLANQQEQGATGGQPTQ
jgi:hypothetical protein